MDNIITMPRANLLTALLHSAYQLDKSDGYESGMSRGFKDIAEKVKQGYQIELVGGIDE